MPLLPPEPFLYPDDLLVTPTQPSAGAARWWVLHTRPRAEKCLARRCRQAALPFFLPLLHRRWRHRNRAHSSYVPLFPGYVFLHGDADVRLAALETNLIVHVLPVADQAQLHADLFRVNQLLAGDAPLTAEERLQPGAPVEILEGPFRGLQGKFLRRGTQARFVVEVQLLKRGVSMEIDSTMLRFLDDVRQDERRSRHAGAALC